MVIAKDRDFLKYLIIVSIVLLVFLLKDSRHQGLANTQNVSKLKLDGVELNILIRKTLLTLNDANLTGNYTVLRDLSAPEFQKQFNAARLSETFADLRKRKLDLSPIVLFHPKLTRKPEFKGKNIIRLTGYIPTKPEQVNFDIFFQRNSNRWLLIGLSVNTKKTNNVSARKPKRNIKNPNKIKKITKISPPIPIPLPSPKSRYIKAAQTKKPTSVEFNQSLSAGTTANSGSTKKDDKDSLTLFKNIFSKSD